MIDIFLSETGRNAFLVTIINWLTQTSALEFFFLKPIVFLFTMDQIGWQGNIALSIFEIFCLFFSFFFLRGRMEKIVLNNSQQLVKIGQKWKIAFIIKICLNSFFCFKSLNNLSLIDYFNAHLISFAIKRPHINLSFFIIFGVNYK